MRGKRVPFFKKLFREEPSSAGSGSGRKKVRFALEHSGRISVARCGLPRYRHLSCRAFARKFRWYREAVLLPS